MTSLSKWCGVLIALSLMAACSISDDSPYPESRCITSLTWSKPSTIVRKAPGSDTWPMTWADDNALYTTFGDGWGFEPQVPDKLSLGLAKIIGGPDDFTGINIRSTGERHGDGPRGKKASGMLMVDHVLYMWVRNADLEGRRCQLAWSKDYARSWTWSDWVFTEFGYCAFLNFGKNYAGARDDYVYVYAPDTPSAYEETDQAVLARAPKTRIMDKSSYDFFAGLDQVRQPIWTSDVRSHTAVFEFPGGVNRMDVTYNRPLRRYLMTMRSRAIAGGLNQFSIYEAPEPWGPWATVYYTLGADGWGESQHIPSKWISEDGRTIYLVFSGGDSFSIRKAGLITENGVCRPASKGTAAE
jgi:hypothetical protein